MNRETLDRSDTESCLGTSRSEGRKRLHIKSFGCQMNVYDASRMADVLALQGYDEGATMEDADLIILNTCNIREKAADKVYSELGRVREIKQLRASTGKATMIAVAGCVAQAEGEELLRKSKAVDLVVGPQSYHRLPSLINSALAKQRPVATDLTAEEKFQHLPQVRVGTAKAAFLTVQEGCDKFCTFCVVPYTRGVEMSRPMQNILAEARRLTASGVREITLLGQNVNAYRGEGRDGGSADLSKLLYALAELPELARLRYMTSHPADMNEALIATHRDLPQLMPYLHLPVQSGSDRILKAMNRRHNVNSYRRIIDKMRHIRPDIALSSDFIVGFPGESDADFAATMNLIQDTGYAAAYSFKFSPRPGTPAANRKAQIPEEIKTERLHALQALIREQQDRFNSATVGRVVDVLVEKKGRDAGQLSGRSPYLQAVHFAAPERLIGSVVPVKIVECLTNSLTGQYLPETKERAA